MPKGAVTEAQIRLSFLTLIEIPNETSLSFSSISLTFPFNANHSGDLFFEFTFAINSFAFFGGIDKLSSVTFFVTQDEANTIQKKYSAILFIQLTVLKFFI